MYAMGVLKKMTRLQKLNFRIYNHPINQNLHNNQIHTKKIKLNKLRIGKSQKNSLKIKMN